MGGITWDVDPIKLAKKVGKTRTQLSSFVNQAVITAGSVARTNQIRIINTTGTGHVGEGARADPNKRVDYGYMVDAVKTWQTLDGRKINSSLGNQRFSSSFGWLHDQRHTAPEHDNDFYFVKQEYGTELIAPMHSLSWGTHKANEYLVSRLDKISLRDFFNKA